jgi:hypothetical protein
MEKKTPKSEEGTQGRKREKRERERERGCERTKR